MLDWNAIPKLDAHIHLMPPDVIEENRGYGDKFVDYGDADDYLALMERYHIAAACIMPFNDPRMLSMDFRAESVHRNLRELCARGAGRLFCFADIDMDAPVETTLALLDEAMEHDEFLGVKIHPTNTGYPIDGAYYDRIFAWADENRVLVEIHSYPRAHLADDVCSPSRILKVRRKYPRLRISVAHLGGFQYEAFAGQDLWFNLSAILPDLADRYSIPGTNKILRELGVERLVFATDYPDSRRLKPEEIYDRYFELLGQMDFSFSEAEMICRHNALKMLGLPPEKD